MPSARDLILHLVQQAQHVAAPLQHTKQPLTSTKRAILRGDLTIAKVERCDENERRLLVGDAQDVKPSPRHSDEQMSWTSDLAQIEALPPKQRSLAAVARVLTTLNLSGAKLSSLDLREFKHLKTLSVSSNPDITELSGVPASLTTLEAYDCSIAAISWKPTALPQLTSLALSYNPISDAALLAIVQACPALSCLDLAWTHISDTAAAIAALQKLPALRILALEGSPLSLFSSYRRSFVCELPQLRALDGSRIQSSEREACSTEQQLQQQQPAAANASSDVQAALSTDTVVLRLELQSVVLDAPPPAAERKSSKSSKGKTAAAVAGKDKPKAKPPANGKHSSHVSATDNTAVTINALKYLY
jgi:Leucine Rich repeat